MPSIINNCLLLSCEILFMFFKISVISFEQILFHLKLHLIYLHKFDGVYYDEFHCFRVYVWFNASKEYGKSGVKHLNNS